MSYPNCLMVSLMKKMDLFDNVPYKNMKNLNDDDDIEVEIEDFVAEGQREWECSARFTFILEEELGWWREYVVETTYNSSSIFAMIMIDLYEEDWH